MAAEMDRCTATGYQDPRPPRPSALRGRHRCSRSHGTSSGSSGRSGAGPVGRASSAPHRRPSPLRPAGTTPRPAAPRSARSRPAARSRWPAIMPGHRDPGGPETPDQHAGEQSGAQRPDRTGRNGEAELGIRQPEPGLDRGEQRNQVGGTAPLVRNSNATAIRARRLLVSTGFPECSGLAGTRLDRNSVRVPHRRLAPRRGESLRGWSTRRLTTAPGSCRGWRPRRSGWRGVRARSRSNWPSRSSTASRSSAVRAARCEKRANHCRAYSRASGVTGATVVSSDLVTANPAASMTGVQSG